MQKQIADQQWSAITANAAEAMNVAKSI